MAIGLAAALAGALIFGGYQIHSLRGELDEERARAARADQRAQAAEHARQLAEAEAREARGESADASQTAEQARTAAEEAAEKALSADELAAQMRRNALSAEQTAEQALEQMRAAMDRAERFERELGEARKQVENALSRVRAAEELERQAKDAADGASSKAQQSERLAHQVRRDLQERTRLFLDALDQARKAVVEAAKEHRRATDIANQAENAVELAAGGLRSDSDSGPSAGSALHDFRNLQQRANRAAERARVSLDEAAQSLAAMRKRLTEME